MPAVRILVEHVEGVAFEIVVPYRKRVFGGYAYKPAQRRQVPPEVFKR